MNPIDIVNGLRKFNIPDAEIKRQLANGSTYEQLQAWLESLQRAEAIRNPNASALTGPCHIQTSQLDRS